MKKLLILLLLLNFTENIRAQEINPEEKTFRKENDSIRKATDLEFSVEGESPLPPEEIEDFKGLEYFPFDMAFVVKATFVPTPGQKSFEMPTTTERKPRYRKEGELHFVLQNDSLKLSVYRNLELSKRPGFENYLFLPFTDSTNGFESYGGGRYLDLQGPLSDTIIIDFNKAYNPYCAYNHRYSCPIPPQENHLPLRIEAGVLSYEKH